MITPESLCSSWCKKPLGDAVDFLDHLRRPITAADRESGPYPYYGANGQQDSVAGYIFDEPLILLAEDGGYFGDPERTIAYRVQGKCWVNNHAHVLRPKPGVDIDFLCRLLERYDVTRFINGATRQKLNKGIAEQIPVALPPLDEQRRIAAILDKADAIRRKRQESIRLTEEFLRSTFLEMFGDPVMNPKGWELRELGSVLSLITYGLTVRPDYVSDGIPLISAKEIRSGYIDFNGAPKISVGDYESLSDKAKPLIGDILFSKTGSIGHSALVSKSTTIALTQNAARLVFKRQLVDNTYALNYLRADSIKNLAVRSACGNAVKDLQLGVMKTFPFPLPPLPLQQKFANKSSIIERMKAFQNNAVIDSENIFNSLTHRAFRGEL